MLDAHTEKAFEKIERVERKGGGGGGYAEICEESRAALSSFGGRSGGLKAYSDLLALEFVIFRIVHHFEEVETLGVIRFHGFCDIIYVIALTQILWYISHPERRC